MEDFLDKLYDNFKFYLCCLMIIIAGVSIIIFACLMFGLKSTPVEDIQSPNIVVDNRYKFDDAIILTKQSTELNFLITDFNKQHDYESKQSKV